LYGYLNGLRSARKLEKECARNIELNGFYAQSYPTTIVYPTLESRISIGIKKSVQTLCFFLKDAELIAVKSSLLMEPKAERTTVRKRTSIKRK
jgi:hypothetical protein